MLEKRRAEKEKCVVQVDNIINIDRTIQKRKTEIKQSIDLIDEIIASGGISDTHLRMFIDQIIIKETKKGLDISIDIKAPFRMHSDEYENGELVAKSFELAVIEECSEDTCCFE